jgi:hypothetical protein
MNRTFTVTATLALAAALLVAGCSATVTTPAPGSTKGPGATPAPQATPAGGGGTATPAGGDGGNATPAAVASGSSDCTGFTPGASLPADAALLAKFPQQVGGQPISNPVAYSLAPFLCQGGQTGLDAAKGIAALLGFDPTTMSVGTFDATVNGTTQSVQAMRTPNQDAGKLISSLQLIAGFAGINAGNGAISQGNVGGKNVTVITDSSGSKTFIYVSGDTLFIIDGADDATAAAIRSAMS